MQNTGEEDQVHERSGQSRTQVGGILQDVLSKAGEYSIGESLREEAEMQDIKIGVCYLQGAYLYGVLEGGIW